MDRNNAMQIVIIVVDASLSARRAWIEILILARQACLVCVALRKESVDRNCEGGVSFAKNYKSLSARRAWIEIDSAVDSASGTLVALRKESVDRNIQAKNTSKDEKVALRKESVDRNLGTMQIVIIVVESLSARRAWIEIIDDFEPSSTRKSLSARRAWIEIKCRCLPAYTQTSLSARRAWIEMRLA